MTNNETSAQAPAPRRVHVVAVNRIHPNKVWTQQADGLWNSEGDTNTGYALEHHPLLDCQAPANTVHEWAECKRRPAESEFAKLVREAIDFTW